jgi:hypothetical protein
MRCLSSTIEDNATLLSDRRSPSVPMNREPANRPVKITATSLSVSRHPFRLITANQHFGPPSEKAMSDSGLTLQSRVCCP